MTELYERNLNISVSKLSDDEILTKASLLDLNHNIRIQIRVDVASKKITRAEAQMVKSPFVICAQTLDKIRKIVGLRIERGIHQKLVDALGHSDGCTHLVDLAMEAVRLSANVLLGFTRFDIEWRERKLTDEEFIEQVKPILKNSCLPFKEDDR
ncbi:MAG TPA: DUF2889 domain-containing protein [Bacteroidota bacterium]|nr:DUF2889 domain-containing protein [Bacteroidota bacterium]